MLYAINLSNEEDSLLEQHYKTSGVGLVRERAHAILLSSEGKNVPEIAIILRRAENTIREWINSFNKTRMSSIFAKYGNNENASKLTNKQKQQIKETLNKPPSEYGLPKQFWNVPLLKKYIRAEFGVVYESERSYHFILKYSNLSFKLPDTEDIRRDEHLIEKRIKEIRDEIKPFCENENCEILVSDECRIDWESEIRKAWIKKGEKTIIKIYRNNEYQNFIGFLDLKTKKPYLFKLNWQNQEEIIESLKKLKKFFLKKDKNKIICLIWDNAKWHKGKLIRKELSKEGCLSNFHLINFPPYAPDKNPQEHIWKYAKEKVANESLESFKDTIDQFRRVVLSRNYDYEI